MVVLQFCLVTTSVLALVGRTLRRSRGYLTKRGEGFAFVVGTQFSIRWKIDSKAASLRRDREVLRSMGKTLRQAQLRQDGLGQRQRSEHFFTRPSPFMRSGWEQNARVNVCVERRHWADFFARASVCERVRASHFFLPIFFFFPSNDDGTCFEKEKAKWRKWKKKKELMCACFKSSEEAWLVFCAFGVLDWTDIKRSFVRLKALGCMCSKQFVSVLSKDASFFFFLFSFRYCRWLES